MQSISTDNIYSAPVVAVKPPDAETEIFSGFPSNVHQEQARPSYRMNPLGPQDTCGTADQSRTW